MQFISRPQHIIYDNAYYHVMNRGAGQRNIFTTRADREIFLQTVGEAYHQFCIEVHAYCLWGIIILRGQIAFHKLKFQYSLKAI